MPPSLLCFTIDCWHFLLYGKPCSMTACKIVSCSLGPTEAIYSQIRSSVYFKNWRDGSLRVEQVHNEALFKVDDIKVQLPLKGFRCACSEIGRATYSTHLTCSFRYMQGDWWYCWRDLNDASQIYRTANIWLTCCRSSPEVMNWMNRHIGYHD